jgi:hypothetical protein
VSARIPLAPIAALKLHLSQADLNGRARGTAQWGPRQFSNLARGTSPMSDTPVRHRNYRIQRVSSLGNTLTAPRTIAAWGIAAVRFHVRSRRRPGSGGPKPQCTAQRADAPDTPRSLDSPAIVVGKRVRPESQSCSGSRSRLLQRAAALTHNLQPPHRRGPWMRGKPKALPGDGRWSLHDHGSEGLSF